MNMPAPDAVVDADRPAKGSCSTVEEALQRVGHKIASPHVGRFVRDRLEQGSAVRFTVSVKARKGGGFNVWVSSQVVTEQNDLNHYAGVE